MTTDRLRDWLMVIGSTLAISGGIGAGCAAAGSDPADDGGNGSSGGGSPVSSAGNGGSPTTAGQGGAGGDTSLVAAGTGGMESCASFTAEAELEPAAMLTVLDASASMTTQNKWGTAQIAIVQALDKDVFDSMWLGLSTFPSGFTQMPECLCTALGGPGLCTLLLPNGVACGYPVLPQIAMNLAGKDKSNAPSGVRKDIYQYLVSKSPINDPSDASPIYDSLAGAYLALKSKPVDNRIVVLVTDGGFSCTSLANPPRPGYSDGACNDWEYPDSVNTLIGNARTDPNQPIHTFIVGVPGSDSTGQMQGNYATAPYSMKLALSTYAVSGSPDTVDPACDKAAVFDKNAPAPAKPCHIDLSGGGFDLNALAKAIADIRGKALGCVYELPEPPPGETIDPNLVNVYATIDQQSSTILKRSNPADECLADGCWDYDADGKVELIGKACADVSSATEAKIEIAVGCTTLIK